MAIKIEMLRYFVEVARSGNLATAAAHLGRSPSALSMTLRQLEENLGAPLFESDRKSRLTPLGEFVLSEAERDIQQFDRTLQSIQQFVRSPQGFLRVAAVPSAAETIVIQALPKFQAKYPDEAVEIQDADTDAVVSAVSRGKLDLGIVSSPSASATGGLKRETIATDQFGILYHREYCPFDTAVSWRHLSRHPFINNHLCQRVVAPEIKSAADASTLTVRNTSSLIAMVRAGSGITVLPELACANIEPELCFVVPKGPKFTREIQAIWSSDRPLTDHGQYMLSLFQKN